MLLFIDYMLRYINLFKVKLLFILMEKSDNKLTSVEKGEIFEYVNDIYLKLKGNKKKSTKNCFKTSWKEDNMCYTLFMKLYNAYDMWSENELDEEWIYERDNLNDDVVSKKKHRRVINMLHRSEYELEQELEKIKEGKGYISEVEYKDMIQEQKRNYEQTILELNDSVQKSKTLEEGLRSKIKANDERFEAMKLYYEDQIKKLSMDKL